MKKNIFTTLATCLMCLCAISANAQSDYYMSMPDVQANGGGTVTVPVSLTNAGGIFSFQIEVFLPDGVDIVSIEGSDRTANAEFFDYSQEDKYTDDNQRYRRIIIGNVQNMTESAIGGNEGELFYINFQVPEGEGVYPITLKNIQYINPPTFALNYMDDVTATITAADYFFTFPENIQVTADENFVVPLNLHNTGGIYSIQIDLMLADGVEFVDATLGERVNAEFFQYGSEDKYTEDNIRYRRVIFANLMNTNSTVSGNEGVVVNYTLKMNRHADGTYPIRVMNIQYFNPPTYELHYIDDAEGTINVTPFAEATPGDVNHDGLVDINDVTAVIAKVLGTENCCTICADVDGNQDVDINDVTIIINYVLTGHWTE